MQVSPRNDELHGADVLEGRRLAVVGCQDAKRETEMPQVASLIRPDQNKNKSQQPGVGDRGRDNGRHASIIMS